MRSPLMEAIGLGGVDIAWIFIAIFILIILLTVLYAVQLSKYNNLKKKYAKFMKGKDGKSLEKDIIKLFEDNMFIKNESEKNKSDIRELQRRIKYCYQKIGLEKYDAYNQMGGKLSFCLCLLDERDCGFILNSVHGSDSCYSYTKEIQRGECSISLGLEEQRALEKALGK